MKVNNSVEGPATTKRIGGLAPKNRQEEPKRRSKNGKPQQHAVQGKNVQRVSGGDEVDGPTRIVVARQSEKGGGTHARYKKKKKCVCRLHDCRRKKGGGGKRT